MADEFFEQVSPVSGKAPIDRLGGDKEPPRPARAATSIAGRIAAVHRASRQQQSGHTLDVVVGGDEFTEIVLRVPRGAYGHLEGKRAVLYIDE